MEHRPTQPLSLPPPSLSLVSCQKPQYAPGRLWARQPRVCSALNAPVVEER